MKKLEFKRAYRTGNHQDSKYPGMVSERGGCRSTNRSHGLGSDHRRGNGSHHGRGRGRGYYSERHTVQDRRRRDNVSETEASPTRRNRGSGRGRRGGFRGFQPQSIEWNTPRPNNATPEASGDIRRFMQRLQAVAHQPTGVLRLDNEDELNLWFLAWAAASVGAEPALAPALVQVFLRLPSARMYAPPAPHVWSLLAQLASMAPRDAVVPAFSLLADVIEKRLEPALVHMQEPQICATLMNQLLHATNAPLLAAVQDASVAQQAGPLMLRLTRVLLRCIDYVQHSERREGENSDAVSSTSGELDWTGWRQPNIEWLLDGRWLNAPQLQSTYGDIDAYILIVRQTMTMLAFYWAAAALFPRCRNQRGEGPPCGQPLCAAIPRNLQMQCTHKSARARCPKPAVWRCSRRGHDAICRTCNSSVQGALCGVPGRGASTDVYDAVVQRETRRRDGVVYVLSEVCSRRPPKISPNWRTTYRLKSSAMVAIVRLGASCQPLRRTDRIDWAEIVPVTQKANAFNQDYTERESGRLAIRLLTRTDLSSLTADAESLIIGSRVAIIDVQTFVPEVISVLSALADESLVPSVKNIPFAQKLIGAATPTTDGKEDELDRTDNCSNVLKRAIELSEISFIRRLDSRIKIRLHAELVNIARKYTLDGTQLSAFAAALQSGLHCTWGPPGSGKSYLGVQLIRALDAVRRCVEQCGISIGPIIALSYKNHALDELLLDVVNCNTIVQRPSALIRCGKSEDTRLERYSERRSPQEQRAQHELSSRVAHMRSVRRTLRDFRSLRSALQDDSDASLHSWTVSGSNVRSGVKIAVKMLFNALRFHSAEVASAPDNRVYYVLLNDLVSLNGAFNTVDCNIVLALVKKLGKDVEHWRPAADANDEGPRAVFLLENWLNGAIPPPRCAAWLQDGCPMPAVTLGGYCDNLHRCMYAIGCARRRDEDVMLCAEHRCSFLPTGDVPCTSARLTTSTVCHEHACFICVKIRKEPISPRQGGTVCLEHMCHIPGCFKERFNPLLLYCVMHACRACSHFAAKSGIPPNEGVNGERLMPSWFCNAHKCQVKECIELKLMDKLETQLYCDRHACDECVGQRHSVDETFPLARLCVKHRCVLEKCPKKRIADGKFCKDHTCFVCRESGVPLKGAAINVPPRNTCAEHPLCTHIDINGLVCHQIAFGISGGLCEKHYHREKNIGDKALATVSCEGVTKRRNPCKSNFWPTTRPPHFCNSHIEQRPSSDSSSSSSSSEDETDFYEDAMSDFSGKNNKRDANMFYDTSIDQVLLYDAQKPMLLNVGGEANDQDRLVGNIATQPPLDSEYIEEQNAMRNERNNSAPVPVCINKFQGEETPFDQSQSDDSEHSSSFEAVDVDRPAFGASIDELSVSSDSELSEGPVPDNLEHLHDIVGGDDECSQSDNSESDTVNTSIDANEDFLDAEGNDPTEWSWDKPCKKRRALIASFLGCVLNRAATLIAHADDYVEEGRRDLAESAALAFKNARVVGATIVGATRRLHAIRASEPFAMIVEEACEVMEPTLLSMLSVPSLQKLELIGDHRQLPAFVQPCWFSIQNTHPSIKVSLFERLVEGGSVPYSLLDVQRRMRPEIADLTRCEYKDRVEIIDHVCTVEQRIADHEVSVDRRYAGSWINMSSRRTAKIVAQRALWKNNGMSVPGTSKQVYFWNIDGSKEGRASVGLSRCNETEAKAVVGLVQWFLLCGVPPQCITVITPFKGQKTTILKLARKEKNDALKMVSVSTVDRYQGDENDIIVLSLVSTQGGNRFVALRNRFIVAASRARLGFFIIGSSKAVSTTARGGERPTHWSRLLSDLESCPNTPGQSRIGSKISICCPRHPDVTLDVATPTDFPLSKGRRQSFCEQLCTFSLPWCGHICQRTCHSPDELDHTTQCRVEVERSCDEHKHIELLCGSVKAQCLDVDSLTGALALYKCIIPVSYRREECAHAVQLKCYKHKELLSGIAELEKCTEIENDFVNPTCGHVQKKPKCYQRRLWETSPPMCNRKVEHKRACGCIARMSCYERTQEQRSTSTPTCMEAVVKARPRCTHLLSSRCFEATKLKELWLYQDGIGAIRDPPVVEFGISYGPNETTLALSSLMKTIVPCLVDTLYKRSCGHRMMVQCDKSFELAIGAADEGSCKEMCEIESPLCGHNIQVECDLRKLVSTLPRAIFSKSTVAGSVDCIATENIFQAKMPHPRLRKLTKLCDKSVRIRRSCGHDSEPILCTRLFILLTNKALPVCNSTIELQRDCGHMHETTCYLRDEPIPECPQPINEQFLYPQCKYNHSVRPGTCGHLAKLQSLEAPKCNVPVQVTRPRCRHEVIVACHLERTVTKRSIGSTLDISGIVDVQTSYCDPEPEVPHCVASVVLRRECGHEESEVPCHVAFEQANGEHVTPCRWEENVVSPLCGHEVKVQCNRLEEVHEAEVWEDDRVPPRITLNITGGKSESCFVVRKGNNSIVASAGILALLCCTARTRVQSECGHERSVICNDLVHEINALCKREEDLVCDNCGVQRRVLCHALRTDAVPPCRSKVDKTCGLCLTNNVRTECYREDVRCGTNVRAPLECKHDASWICGSDEDPRQSKSNACLICLHKAWKSTHKRIKDEDVFADGAILLQALQAQSMKCLENMDTSFKETYNDIDLKRLYKAYDDLLAPHVDLFSQAVQNDEDDFVVQFGPPDLMDVLGAYHIVYTVLPKEQYGPICQRTVYGLGFTAKLLTSENVRREINGCDDEGNVQLKIWAVLRIRGLRGVAPFRNSESKIIEQANRILGSKKRKKSKNGNNAQKKAAKSKTYLDDRLRSMENQANNMMFKYQLRGYDHVWVEDDDGSIVYWCRDAIISLGEIEVKLTRNCPLCLEQIAQQKGWFCNGDESHFLCGTCFLANLKASGKPDAIHRSTNDRGRMRCPECPSVFTPLVLMQQREDLRDDDICVILEEMENLRMNWYAQKEVRSAVEVQDKKHRAELEALQAMDVEERHVAKLRGTIIQQVLTQRCPNDRCRMAFDIFDGCLALTCRRCYMHFCGLCLIHWSRGDVHGHVQRCAKNNAPDGLFLSLEDYEKYQIGRKRNKVIQIIKSDELDSGTRLKLLGSLEIELRTNSITIDESEVL